MAWFARIAIGYAFLMLLGIALIQFLARADHHEEAVFISGDRLYALVTYADIRIPAIFGGAGPEPGEVSVVDVRGRTLDSQHLDDISSVHNIHWKRYRVDFEYERGSQTYATSLALPQ